MKKLDEILEKYLPDDYYEEIREKLKIELEQFKKEIELETLQNTQFLFKVQSDLSCDTNGYRSLCEQIKQLAKQK